MKRLLLLVLTAIATPAFAWGPVAHRVIARVAESQLDSRVRARAQALNDGASLVELATEADEIRNARPETKLWHFVDIPIAKNAYVESRDCRNDDCVVDRIEQFQARLANKNLSTARRREALMFLVHLIADVHQPLHASDNHDDGGTDTTVRFGSKKRKFHSVWDSGLVSRAGTEASLTAELRQMIARGVPAGTANGDAEDWANESHKAGQAAYAQILKDHRLSSAESTEDEQVVKRQLLRASLRLAKALNEALQ
ncbi:MAG TPA: S1/P1 nuclease [Thermoanaerobaculia bacterium]|nr:S1/P1 nuclease [Thermoanaerobaculia bacterium]